MLADKSALRQRMRQERKAWPAALRQQISDKICMTLLKHEAYLRAHTVFAYVSTDQELDTTAILQQVLQDGKILCVPRCEQAGVMSARQITALDMLHAGSYGILEPDAQALVIAPKEIDLIVVPALACDKQGYRLGYGGGYYDRFLAQTSAVRAALCAQSCVLDRLPVESFDQPCDLIFTDRQVLQLHEK